MSDEEKEPEVKKGRPRKRDRAVVAVSEALGIRIAADVLSLSDIDGFPSFEGLSERCMGIMCLHACGMSQLDIADAFQVSQPYVCKVIRETDPHGMFKLSPQAKHAITNRLLERNVLGGLLVTSLDELRELPVDKRANVIAKFEDVLQKRNQSKHRDITGSVLDSMMDDIAAESGVIEGDFEANKKDDGSQAED